MIHRINRLREQMNRLEADAMFVHSYENRRYFSGFSGSNGYLVITENEAILITDQRYGEQAKQQTDHFTIYVHGIDPFETIGKAIRSVHPTIIGYESKEMSDYFFRQLKRVVPSLIWHPLEDELLQIRAVKDNEEIALIKKSVEIADAAMAHLSSYIQPGMTEKEVGIELEYTLAKLGSEGPAFGTIVASGKRSALPHGAPTDKTIETGDWVTVDYGARYGGYMSDITRTFSIGTSTEQMQSIHDYVLLALEKAIDRVKPGVTCGELDAVARQVFEEADLESFSLRGLGHGIGLAIHEFPRVVMKHPEPLLENMIFTIEPGLYLPGIGGVRIEDDVLVTADGCEVLTKSPRVIPL